MLPLAITGQVEGFVVGKASVALSSSAGGDDKAEQVSKWS